MVARKKKLFLGNKPIGGTVMKSRKLARKVTSKFHQIKLQMENIEKNNKISDKEKKILIKKLKQELESMGGIKKYQEASVISTQHYSTSKWIVSALKRLEKIPKDVQIKKKKKNNIRINEEEEENEEDFDDEDELEVEISSSTPYQLLKTLEVGAINDQLSNCPLLKVRAIDINSRLPCVEEKNFFDVPPTLSYDVVVCSMVINCCFDPYKRCEMIARLNMQLNDEGILFLILPKRCLTTKNLPSGDYFLDLLYLLGLELKEEVHETPRLVFYVLGRNKERIDDKTKKIMKKLRNIVDLNKNENDEEYIKVNSSLWQKIIINMMKKYEGKTAKNFFVNSIKNPDEFGLEIPKEWLKELKE